MILSENIYHFKFSNEYQTDEVPNVEDTYITLDGEILNLKLSELFVSYSTKGNNTIKGYTILEHLAWEHPGAFATNHFYLGFQQNEKTVYCYRIKKPWFQMNDKEAEWNEYADKIRNEAERLQLIESEDEGQEETEYNEEIEETKNESQYDEEEKTDSQIEVKSDGNEIHELTKFKQDFQSFIDKGFEVHSQGDYRLIYKRGFEPILIKIEDEKAGNYTYLNYIGSDDKYNHRFYDEKGEEIIFTIE